jgi:hypothetical protein
MQFEDLRSLCGPPVSGKALAQLWDPWRGARLAVWPVLPSGEMRSLTHKEARGNETLSGRVVPVLPPGSR